MRESVLGSYAMGDRVPEWLEKWVALVLDFVEQEQRLLPPQLCALPPPAFYTPVAADIEARGLLPALPADGPHLPNVSKFPRATAS